MVRSKTFRFIDEHLLNRKSYFYGVLGEKKDKGRYSSSKARIYISKYLVREANNLAKKKGIKFTKEDRNKGCNELVGEFESLV